MADMVEELFGKALEYAANHIDGDSRRGVWVKAFVEGEDWAYEDLQKWLCNSSEERDSNEVQITGEGFQPVPEEAFASADRHDTNDLIADTLACMEDLETNGDD